MKIRDILDKKMSFSFEVFPPKQDQPIEPLIEVIHKLNTYKPDFISCTYGAGGTNKGRSTDICDAISKSDINCMTHFTCIGNTKDDVLNSISCYKELGLENVLALRGDIPAGWEGTCGDFAHANELIEFIKEHFPQLCIAAACYPEKHMQNPSLESDITHLRIKQNKGAEFLMSQLCFDVAEYERWKERIVKAGVSIPVVMGIMPVLSANGIKRMTLGNGCSIPRELAAIIGKYGEAPDDFKKAGKEYTVCLINQYINAGVNGIHIYSLNKYDDVAEIISMAGL